MIQITNRDKKLITQKILEIRFKMEVYDENDHILDNIEGGIVSGSSSISADSDVRRTFNVEIVPNRQFDVKIKEHNLIWLNRKVKFYIGVRDMLRCEYVWYPQGVYVFSNTSITYDATTNQISISCSDLMAKLDGTKNGQLGQKQISFSAYEEDKKTGTVIKYNYIRDQVIITLDQLGRIKDYNVDEIGEYKAMPQYNIEWEKYRKESQVPVKDGTLMETWNAMPFDQEFSSGCTILSILTAFRDLYPNYEMFFDENGTFVFQMIPSCYEDDIILDDSYLQEIYINENISTDLSTVRNMCEVWGEIIDADFFATESTYKNNVYSCTINSYEKKYYNGDLIGIKICSANEENPSINVNSFGKVEIYDDSTDKPLEADILKPDTVYVFKIRLRYVIDKGETVPRAYLLGHYQAHGMNVLTDGTTGDEFTTTNGVTVTRYSKEYFQEVYNCEDVELTIIPQSPFTIQKLGEILDVKTGGEFENITSTSLALHRAEWENWKNCRLTDNITLTTKLCPFLDVNIKVSYRRHDEDEIKQYIIKSVSHDFSGGTSTINMMRFYPLYQDYLNSMLSHEGLSRLTHGALSYYTHEQISTSIINKRCDI